MAYTRRPLVEPLLMDMPRLGWKNRTVFVPLVGFAIGLLLIHAPSITGGGGQPVKDEKLGINMLGLASVPSVGTRVLAQRQPAPAGTRGALGFSSPAQNFMQPASFRSPARVSMQPAAYRLFPVDPFDSIFWGTAQPPKPRQERKENLDLWREREPARKTEQDIGSPTIFNRRNPFENISQIVDLPTGHYTSRSFISKSHYGPNGEIVTERYASSAAGNGKEGIHEAKHVYSNSTSGIEKASHEQHLRGRSRMAVTEYGEGKERDVNHIYHGMNATENEVFDREFDKSTEHLPDRAELSRDVLESPSHRLSSGSRAVGYGNRHLADLLTHF